MAKEPEKKLAGNNQAPRWTRRIVFLAIIGLVIVAGIMVLLGSSGSSFGTAVAQHTEVPLPSATTGTGTASIASPVASETPETLASETPKTLASETPETLASETPEASEIPETPQGIPTVEAGKATDTPQPVEASETPESLATDTPEARVQIAS